MKKTFVLLGFLPVLATCLELEDGFSSIALEAQNGQAIQDVLKSFEDLEHCKYTVKYHRSSSGSHVANVLIAPELKQKLLEEPEKRRVKWTLAAAEFMKLIEEDEIARQSSNHTIYDDFLKLEQIETYLSDLEATHGDLVQLHHKGSTHENRSLTIVQIGKCSTCPAIFIEAGIHAREWLAHAVALNIIDNLVQNYPDHRYTEELTWFILPVANPDGYVETHANRKHRLWRKNRRPPVSDEPCPGVDLNRNFAYDWGGEGTSTHPGSGNYLGPSAESEPETQAIVSFVEERLDQIRSYVAVHTFGQLFIYPCPTVDCFDEDHGVVKLAHKVGTAIFNVNGVPYKVGSDRDTISYVSGATDLWALYSKNITFSYTIELRPADGGNRGFIPKATEIKPTSREIWAGFDVIADFILNKYGNH